jgi:hypothetical protein
MSYNIVFIYIFLKIHIDITLQLVIISRKGQQMYMYSCKYD